MENVPKGIFLTFSTMSRLRKPPKDSKMLLYIQFSITVLGTTGCDSHHVYTDQIKLVFWLADNSTDLTIRQLWKRWNASHVVSNYGFKQRQRRKTMIWLVKWVKNNRAARAVRTLLEFFDVCQTTKLIEMKTIRVKRAKVHFAYFL